MYSSDMSLHKCDWLPLEQLRNTSVLITGGTGLVGFNLLQELSCIADSLNIHLYALVRNEEKARKIFAPFFDKVSLIIGDVIDPIQLDSPVDYIIHGACITSSRSFVEQPVETIMTSVMGMKNLLEFAKGKKVRSMVYLSSMEVYGAPEDDRLLTEADVGYLNPLSVRSSYPESKRLCEALCVAYAQEFAIPVKIARLAQTFGPGMQAEDNRAIVQFVRSAILCEDILIKTSGESTRMYLFTFDAVSALLTLLLKGKDGVAYNIANKNSYCSVRCLAETVVKVLSSTSRVLVDTGTATERAIYPPDSFLRLDTSALEHLGWIPYTSLESSLFILSQHIKNQS